MMKRSKKLYVPPAALTQLLLENATFFLYSRLLFFTYYEQCVIYIRLDMDFWNQESKINKSCDFLLEMYLKSQSKFRNISDFQQKSWIAKASGIVRFELLIKI